MPRGCPGKPSGTYWEPQNVPKVNFVVEKDAPRVVSLTIFVQRTMSRIFGAMWHRFIRKFNEESG